MKSSYKAFVLLGVLFAFVLVVSMADDEKKVNEADKPEVTGEADKTEVNGWGGGGGCGRGGCGGGGGGPGYCHRGCCGGWRGGRCIYCCRTAEEAKAYALPSQGLNHAKANP